MYRLKSKVLRTKKHSFEEKIIHALIGSKLLKYCRIERFEANDECLGEAEYEKRFNSYQFVCI